MAVTAATGDDANGADPGTKGGASGAPATDVATGHPAERCEDADRASVSAPDTARAE